MYSRPPAQGYQNSHRYDERRIQDEPCFLLYASGSFPISYEGLSKNSFLWAVLTSTVCSWIRYPNPSIWAIRPSWNTGKLQQIRVSKSISTTTGWFRQWGQHPENRPRSWFIMWGLTKRLCRCARRRPRGLDTGQHADFLRTPGSCAWRKR